MRTLNKLIKIAPMWVKNNISHSTTPIELIQLVEIRESLVALCFNENTSEYSILNFSTNKIDDVVTTETFTESTVQDEYAGAIEYLELETIDDIANYIFMSQFAGEFM